MPAGIFARQSHKRNFPHLCRWKWKKYWWIKFEFILPLVLFDSAVCQITKMKLSSGRIHVIVIVPSIALRKIILRRNHNATTASFLCMNLHTWHSLIVQICFFSLFPIGWAVRYIITWQRKGAKERTGGSDCFQEGQKMTPTSPVWHCVQQSTGSIYFLMTKS